MYSKHSEREEAGMMFCQNCGDQLEEGAVFCTNCGAKVEQAGDTFPESCATAGGLAALDSLAKTFLYK